MCQQNSKDANIESLKIFLNPTTTDTSPISTIRIGGSQYVRIQPSPACLDNCPITKLPRTHIGGRRLMERENTFEEQVQALNMKLDQFLHLNQALFQTTEDLKAQAAQHHEEMADLKQTHLQTTEDLKAQVAQHHEEIANLKQSNSEILTKLETLAPIAVSIRLRAMKDLLLGCLGIEEKDLPTTSLLSENARTFWSSKWAEHADIMDIGMSRPPNESKGTVRNAGDLTAHGVIVSWDDVLVASLGEDQLAAASEGFEVIYLKPPSFYIDNKGFEGLGNLYGLLQNRLNSKKVHAADPATAAILFSTVKGLLLNPAPPQKVVVDNLKAQAEKALF
ncbi:hypothetical protein TWF481_003194 [Arthrobotrys musiformis]|uniref:Uncharacterized protein n=1 Tax=Arthrobotrys musiformis TaxID=47236 RepID=A0AAV9VPI7_9PEZI